MSEVGPKRSWVSVLACACVLLFGGTTTIAQATYLQYTTTNWPGAEGEVKKFQYPWFGNFWMFLGMALVGFWWLYEELRDRKRERTRGAGTAAVPGATAPPPLQGRPSCWNRFLSNPWGVLVFSSIFDLLGSGLNSVGISPSFGVPGSIYQMLHGVIILFTVLLSYLVLKHKPTVQQYISLAIIVVGIVLVATSSLLVEKYFTEESDEPAGPEEAWQARQVGNTGHIVDPHIIETVRFVREVREVTQHIWASVSASVSASFGASFGASTKADSGEIEVTPLSSGAGNLVAGLFLILLGNFVYACQFTLEEFTMRRVTK